MCLMIIMILLANEKKAFWKQIGMEYQILSLFFEVEVFYY